MGKIKARDIIAGWPWPRSVTHPKIDIVGYSPLPYGIATAQSVNESDPVQRLEWRKYHAQQSAHADGTRWSPVYYRPLLLSIQRITGRAAVALRDILPAGTLTFEQQNYRVTFDGYPSGIDILKHGLCGIDAMTPMSCTFCPYGHMMECHYPHRCSDTMMLPGVHHCSHAEREFAAEAPEGAIQ